MFDRKIFSERFKTLRTGKGVSLAELGEFFGVSKQSAQKWETGINVPTVEKMVDLADYFEVTIDYLVGRTDIVSEQIVVKFPNISNLTLPEHELLEAFRALDSYEQGKIVGDVQARAQTSTETKQTNTNHKAG